MGFFWENFLFTGGYTDRPLIRFAPLFPLGLLIMLYWISVGSRLSTSSLGITAAAAILFL